MSHGTIKAQHYNLARGTLVQAGSHTAGKSHVKHQQEGDVPEAHGQQLLGEARDEFQESDKGHPEIHKAGMTQPHYDAIHKAAGQLGLSAPTGPRNGRPKEKMW
jgi:hypothetical protein